MGANTPRQSSNAASPRPATTRSRYHHGDLPSALKQAALALITRHGVEGFSLREAAAAVGVSPSAAYRHFEDKAALLRAIAADAFVEMSERFDEAMRTVRGSGARAAQARFRAQGHAYVNFALRQPERFLVMFGPFGAGAACPQPVAGSSGRTSPYEALSRALDELLAAGVISASRRPGAELLVWSAIHGLATLAVSQALRPLSGEVDSMVVRIAEDCLRALAETPTR